MNAAQDTYSVDLVVEGRRCLIVGGGFTAFNEASRLSAAGALVTVVAPNILENFDQLERTRTFVRPYQRGEVASYHLAIACADPETDRQVLNDADMSGIWAHAATNPEASAFVHANNDRN